MLTRPVCVCLFLIVGCIAGEVAARTWTSSDGGHTIEAEFVELLDEGTVRLKRDDGQLVSVPLDRLSAGDQQLVREKSGKPDAGSPSAISPEEAAKLSPDLAAVLKQARSAMARRDLAAAKPLVEKAQSLARSTDDQRYSAQLLAIYNNLTTFWDAYLEEARTIAGTTGLTVGSTPVIVADADGKDLTVRVAGRNCTFDVVKLDTIPSGLAVALAKRSLTRKGASKSLPIDAFRTVDPTGQDQPRWKAAADDHPVANTLEELASAPGDFDGGEIKPNPRTPTPDPRAPQPRPPVGVRPAPVVTPPAPVVIKKADVPAADVRTQSLAQIKEIFQADYEAAKTDQEKYDLALKLYTTAKDTFSDDSVAAYVLFEEALRLTSTAGDVKGPLGIIKTLDERYKDADVVQLKHDTLNACQRKYRTTEEGHLIVDEALATMERAIKENRIELVQPLGDVALVAARKLGEKLLVDEVLLRVKSARAVESVASDYDRALKDLAEAPDDPRANLAVGTFLCLVSDKWDEGLLHLAKGSDKLLATAAEAELNAEDADSKLAAGDAWWEASQEQGADHVVAMRKRARHWYEAALPQLSSLAKLKVERRLEEIKNLEIAREITGGTGEMVKFLADLEIAANSGIAPPRGDGKLHRPVSIGDKTYQHGIWEQPSDGGSYYRAPTHATLNYQLGEEYRFISGTVGISDETKFGDVAPMKFKIFGDGKLLWVSNVLTQRGQTQTFKVSVSKVKVLTLATIGKGYDVYYTQAVWCDPVLTEKKKRQ